MEMTPKEYQEYVKKMSPDSPLWKDMAMAFLITAFTRYQMVKT